MHLPKFRLPRDLRAAAQLTGAGKLAEATARIQLLLKPAGAVPVGQPDGAVPHAAWTGMADALRHLQPAAAAVTLPPGARFTAETFTNDAGSRAYKLYIPASAPERGAMLIVMLHGCTQSPDDFAAGTRMNALADANGFLVAYPAQPQSANAQKCWNWFNPADQQRGQGEPAILAGLTQHIIRQHRTNPARTYAAGLSAGGAAAAILGATYPEIFAAIGVHSGLACGAARDTVSAFAAMRQGAPGIAGNGRPVPTIVFQGDRDMTVNPRNADAVIAQASGTAAASASSETGQAQGGHAYTRTVHRTRPGAVIAEEWTIHGAGHAWSGGSTAGSFTDPRGPDASAEMVRFFREHPG